MKVIIEDAIFNMDNLIDFNYFVMLCTMAKNEEELRDEFLDREGLKNFKNDLEEKGIRYGFGKHHFWMSEKQYQNEWNRILFIDFRKQN